MTLERLLAKHYRPRGTLGEASERDSLIEDLQQHYRLNFRLTVALFAAMVVAVVGLAAWALAQPDLQGKNPVVLLSAFGGAAAALLEMVRRCVREWSQARLLLAVARGMSQDQIAQLIAKLLEPPKT